MNLMLIGGIAVASFAVSLFFLRYWRSSGDRFFLFFALSFLIEAVNRVLMGLLDTAGDASPVHYLIRLATYALILFAIWDKNRP